MAQIDSLKPVVEKLDGLFNTFNEIYYDGKLQKPIITVSPDSTGGAYGWCTSWKAWKTEQDEHDGYYEINLCAEHLSRPFKQICATLLHEMVHLWCLQEGIKDTSRGFTYHNKKFKENAEQRGLVIEHHPTYGWTKTSLNEQAERIIDEMNDEGFQLYRTKTLKSEKIGGSRKSSSRKYVCPECNLTVRATKEVNIVCGDCDVQMELDE